MPNCPSPISTLTNNFVFLVKCFAEFWDFANAITEKMGSQVILIFISLIWNEVEHLLGNSLAILWLGLQAFTHTHFHTYVCVCVCVCACACACICMGLWLKRVKSGRKETLSSHIFGHRNAHHGPLFISLHFIPSAYVIPRSPFQVLDVKRLLNIQWFYNICFFFRVIMVRSEEILSLL